MQNLFYIEMLLAVSLLVVIGMDVYRYYKRQAYRNSLFQSSSVIYRELEEEEDLEVAAHDVHVLERKLKEQFHINCNLQDYIATWFHEVKLPLSASMLMNEKINDVGLRIAQKEQLEMIRQQLNSALLGCKVQSSLFDLQICAADLLECVKTAIHNNQYFLIQKKFEIKMQIDPVQIYTDPSWFVYVLDQLIQNAMKYACVNPVLSIWSVQKKEEIELYVWDNGEGILECDIRRIFERGYTGSNHHNGQYKSTGMGLYMVQQIIERLGHAISVESEYGEYTRFRIITKNVTFDT